MQNNARPMIAAAAAAALLALGPIARADVSYFTPPKFNHRVLPAYPESARAAHETGSVLIKVLVGADGKPKQFILFRSSGHKDLDAAVLAAAKASTYVPATRGTTPVVAFYDVTFKFTLSGIAQDEGNQSDLAKKLDEHPRDVSTRLLLGTGYLNQKNYAMAEQTFSAGTQLMPTNAKLWAYEGLAYFQDAQASDDAAKFKASADAYDQALRLDSKSDTNNVAAAAYFNYAFHLQQMGQNANALTYGQKAVALAPKVGQYYIIVGETQTALSDYANAVNTFKRAEALDDKKSSIVTSRIVADLGNAELAQGDRVNGLADINRAERIDGQAPFAYEYLFSYYLRNGDRAAALTPLTQLAQLQPNEPTWQVQIGNVYLGQNNIASARAAFQRAQAIKPDSLDAQFGMAEVAAATGDTASIDPIMAKVSAGASPVQAGVYQSSIAIALLNSQKASSTPMAQKYADQATKSDPNNPEAWYALGVAYAQQHNRDQAGVALKRSYALFKAQNNADGMKQVGDVYKQVFGSEIGG